MAFEGFAIGADGVLKRTEMKGPDTYEAWEACFVVLRTALVMLEVASPYAVDAYKSKIQKFHVRFGPSCWLLLYQADIRMRLEHFERIRRRGAAYLAKSALTGASCGFNENQPWEWVFRESLNETSFWKEEFEDWALMVRTHVERVGDHLGLEVSQTAKPVRVSTSAAASDVSDPQRGSKRHHDTPAAKPAKTWTNRYGMDGAYTHNRSNVQLWPGFQNGSCTETNGTNSLRCKADPSTVHQCSKCLGSHTPDKCPVGNTSRPSPAKGKGKGKGRGRGASRQ